MIYTDMESLVHAIWASDTTSPDFPERAKHFERLIQVYWKAYHNPPEGVIGVGAITYAQDALIAAQLNEGN